MSYAVYILKSEKQRPYYIGSSSSVGTRLMMHNSPSARWTKRYQPRSVVHVEKFGTRAEAVQRERFLKSLKGIERHLEDIKGGRI
jgi:putative endonuclease